MSRKTRICIVASFVLAAAVAGFVFAGEKDKTASAGAFEKIKKLSGNWVELDTDGKATDKLVSSFSPTANGSAVVEKLFAGTDHEMITMYHLDGQDVVLTHYCVLGNQPRMRARKDSPTGSLVFECLGGSNLESENQIHMHQGVITFQDDNHIKSEWYQYENGKNVYTASFNLIRKTGDK